MTTAGKILKALLSVFKRKFPKLIDKVYKEIPEDLKPQLHGIIKFVDKVNDAIQDPTFDVLVSLTKSPLDDKLLAILRNYLPTILKDAKGVKLSSIEKHNLASNLIGQYTDYDMAQSNITADVVWCKS